MIGVSIWRFGESFVRRSASPLGYSLRESADRFFSDIGAEFHRLPEGIDARIGDLAGIKEEPVEDHRIRQDISHTGEDDLTGFCLVEDRFPDLPRPDRVAPVVRWFFVDADGVAGAESRAAVAGNTIAGINPYLIPLHPVHSI